VITFYFFPVRTRHVGSGQRTVARRGIGYGRRGENFCELRVWLSRRLGRRREVVTTATTSCSGRLSAHTRVCPPFPFFQLPPRLELDFRFILSSDDRSFRPVSPPHTQLNFELFLSKSVFERSADACVPVALVRAHR